MSISFNQIPVGILVPGVYVEIDNSRANGGLSVFPTKILVLGQMLPAGTATPLEPTRITSADQARALYGAGSMLAQMLAALIKANDYSDCWAIALEDKAAGVAASGTITVSGAVSRAGTLSLMLGGRRVEVGIAAGDPVEDIATAIAGTINAAGDIPVTASAAEGVVTLTARHKGEAGNGIDVRHSYYTGEALPAGLNIAVMAMTGGTGNPDIQAALDVIGDEWFTDFVLPYTDAANLKAIEEQLADQFSGLEMADGHAWTAASGTLATLSTLGLARNSPHLSILGTKGSPSVSWEWAATFAGVAAYHLTIDPARPLQTLSLPGLLPPAIADRFTLQERNILLGEGIATFRVDGGGTVVIERAVTTYKTNAFGADDRSYLDVEAMKTLAFLRYDIRILIGLKFPRHKLADDGTAFSRGQAVVTPLAIQAELVARGRQWEEAGLVENIDQFKADLIVKRDLADPNRVNALIPPNLVNQLRVFAGQIQFLL